MRTSWPVSSSRTRPTPHLAPKRDRQLASARLDVESAERRLLAAEDAQHDAQRADHAAVLRAEMHNGDNCPVCGHTVAEVPTSIEETDLGSAQVAVDAARTHHDTCVAVIGELERDLLTHNTLRAQGLGRAEHLRSKLVEHLPELRTNIILTELHSSRSRTSEWSCGGVRPGGSRRARDPRGREAGAYGGRPGASPR